MLNPEPTIDAQRREAGLRPLVFEAGSPTGAIDHREMARQIFGQTRSTIQNLSTVTGLKMLSELAGGLPREGRLRALATAAGLASGLTDRRRNRREYPAFGTPPDKTNRSTACPLNRNGKPHGTAS